MSEKSLTHIAEDGSASMVDVSGKDVIRREAVARGRIRVHRQTLALIAEDKITKGSVFAVARVAGIQAAKQTANMIPLCHQLPLTRVTVDFEAPEGGEGIEITCRVVTRARTGVEMEALTGVSVAALTIYDMCKAVDKTMEIGEIALISKTKGEEESG